MVSPVLRLSERIVLLPVIHGSGDFAWEVRRFLGEHEFDCLAVPLPPSFQQGVERAVLELPAPALVVQKELVDWSDDSNDERPCASYVPIDPCQAVIAAIRKAIEERVPRAFLDPETNACYDASSQSLPDSYALKRVSLDRFAAAVLPVIPPPRSERKHERLRHIAAELRRLELTYRKIVLVCDVLDWPWIREAYHERAETCEHDPIDEPAIYSLEPNSLIFALGELPFITNLYNRARAELEDDAELSIDGVKELLMAAREAYRKEMKTRARKLTPHALRTCLKYVRNLTLMERRFTPDLYSLVIAAKQTLGDQFALHVAETAREYAPYVSRRPQIKMGIAQARFPGGETYDMVNRLPGSPVLWRSCELRRRPEKAERDSWKMRWNPYSQCSWPPEDQAIENFRTHVFQKAKAIMGADLARTEKFTTSVQDGIDIRDTLRHWYDGEIYVKILPPVRGRLDTAVMLFDSPADPRDYSYRTTWHSEFAWESTLAFFASDFRKEPVGPGICLSQYGGAMFLFPSRSIPDIWSDPRFDFTETLEERLLAAACFHSDCKQIALVAPLPPGAGWRKLAKRFGKQFVHVPLGQFSAETLQQLRMFHVLNGKQVRSFAADFIRKA